MSKRSTPKKPKRKAIPARIKKAVCAAQDGCCPCGCDLTVSAEPKTGTEFDHEPALELRDVESDLSDWIPPQHDAAYIVARCGPSHLAKTSGTGATTAGSDIGKIKKERKRRKAIAAIGSQPKRRFGRRSFPPKGSRKLKGSTQWQKKF